jgi:sugar O-acyltransferase (sialic acid O-acetyltransferase NeuD family)
MSTSSKKPVVVVGTGDFARIARYYLENDSAHGVVAHSLSASLLEAKEYLGLPLVAFEDLPRAYPPDGHLLLIGIAYSRLNRNRREMFEAAKRMGYEMVTYVCSKAITWPDLSVGEGSFIFEANVIQPYVRIGSDTVLWSGNHIGHDSTIGDHIFIASHVVVSGNCRVGDNTFIGVNATIRDGMSIGTNCVIGAGTLVLDHVSDGSVLRGAATEPLPIESGKLSKI